MAVKELLMEGGELAEGFYNFTVPSRHNEMHEIEMNPKRGLFFIAPVRVRTINLHLGMVIQKPFLVPGRIEVGLLLASINYQISFARIGD